MEKNKIGIVNINYNIKPEIINEDEGIEDIDAELENEDIEYMRARMYEALRSLHNNN